MSAPQPPTPGLKLIVSFQSLVFASLTASLDLNKVTGIRVNRETTKADLVRHLETVLFGDGPREEHELFKHGREGQWGWDLQVKGPGMEKAVRLRGETTVGSFAGEDGEGPVEVKPVICYDPEYEDFE